MRVRLLYFASLRDAAGCDAEDIEVEAGSLAQLYDAMRARHRFGLPREHLRVAVDGSFSDWAEPAREGAEIAFIPPVSGG